MISLDPLKAATAAEPDPKTAVANAMHRLLDMVDAAWKVDVNTVRDVVNTWRGHVDAVAEAAVTPPPERQEPQAEAAAEYEGDPDLAPEADHPGGNAPVEQPPDFPPLTADEVTRRDVLHEMAKRTLAEENEMAALDARADAHGLA